MEREWGYDFQPKEISDSDKPVLRDVRTAFETLANALQESLPDGRYKSIVRTKLEEAAMFATKSFSHK